MRTDSPVYRVRSQNRHRWLARRRCSSAALAARRLRPGQRRHAGRTARKEVPAVPVEVAATQRAEMAALYTGTAPVEADRKAFVMPKVQGEIRQVLADEGQRVRGGPDCSPASTATSCGWKSRSTRRRCASSSATTTATSSCSRRAWSARPRIDNLKYELEAAKANWELARLQLSYTRYPLADRRHRHAAPRRREGRQHGDAGRRRHRERRQRAVRRRGPRHADPARQRAGTRAREARRSASRPNSRSTRCRAARSSGKIALISPYRRRRRRRLSPCASASTETGGLLRPGMFARVAIVYERKPDALQIPRTALLDGDGPPKVFVVKDGKAVERAVQARARRTAPGSRSPRASRTASRSSSSARAPSSPAPRCASSTRRRARRPRTAPPSTAG